MSLTVFLLCICVITNAKTGNSSFLFGKFINNFPVWGHDSITDGIFGSSRSLYDDMCKIQKELVKKYIPLSVNDKKSGIRQDDLYYMYGYRIEEGGYYILFLNKDLDEHIASNGVVPYNCGMILVYDRKGGIRDFQDIVFRGDMWYSKTDGKVKDFSMEVEQTVDINYPNSSNNLHSLQLQIMVTRYRLNTKGKIIRKRVAHYKTKGTLENEGARCIW